MIIRYINYYYLFAKNQTRNHTLGMITHLGIRKKDICVNRLNRVAYDLWEQDTPAISNVLLYDGHTRLDCCTAS